MFRRGRRRGRDGAAWPVRGRGFMIQRVRNDPLKPTDRPTDGLQHAPAYHAPPDTGGRSHLKRSRAIKTGSQVFTRLMIQLHSMTRLSGQRKHARQPAATSRHASMQAARLEARPATRDRSCVSAQQPRSSRSLRNLYFFLLRPPEGCPDVAGRVVLQFGSASRILLRPLPTHPETQR